MNLIESVSQFETRCQRKKPGTVCGSMGSLVAEEAFKSAEAYFEKNGVRTLLTEILIELGRDQPADPLAAIRLQIQKAEAQSAGAVSLESEGRKSLEAERAQLAPMGQEPDGPEVLQRATTELPGGPSLDATLARKPGTPQKSETEEHDADSSLLQAAPRAARALRALPYRFCALTGGCAAPACGRAPAILHAGTWAGPLQETPGFWFGLLYLGLAASVFRPLSFSRAQGALLVVASIATSWSAVSGGGVEGTTATLGWVVQESWVPQPSPCCAAASVAGAYNCLWQLGREADACRKLSRGAVRARMWTPLVG